MFYKTFPSSQVKRCAIIDSQVADTDLRLKKLGNQEISEICLNFKE